MAPRIIVNLISKDRDRSGLSLTVMFWPGGDRCEVELSERDAEALHTVVAPLIDAARPGNGGPRGRVPGGRAVTPDTERTRAIRAWARANGYQVRQTGRIANSVVSAYERHLAGLPGSGAASGVVDGHTARITGPRESPGCLDAPRAGPGRLEDAGEWRADGFVVAIGKCQAACERRATGVH